MKASILIRGTDAYPAIAVQQGLEATGYETSFKYPFETDPSRLLVTWTLWEHNHKTIVADKHTNRGGKVLCMENGWVRSSLRTYWQLGERVGLTPGINGWGKFRTPKDGGKRWRSFGIKLKPWRAINEGFILVCPQRGVRERDPDITHGPAWTDSIIKRIRKYTDRPIHWRPHPGAPGRATLPSAKYDDVTVVNPRLPLSDAVREAHTVVVYSSTAAAEAIVQGIPVTYDGPRTMVQDLATRIDRLENPFMPDREPVLHKLAYGQWSSEELRSGEAFAHHEDSIPL